MTTRFPSPTTTVACLPLRATKAAEGIDGDRGHAGTIAQFGCGAVFGLTSLVVFCLFVEMNDPGAWAWVFMLASGMVCVQHQGTGWYER